MIQLKIEKNNLNPIQGHKENLAEMKREDESEQRLSDLLEMYSVPKNNSGHAAI